MLRREFQRFLSTLHPFQSKYRSITVCSIDLFASLSLGERFCAEFSRECWRRLAAGLREQHRLPASGRFGRRPVLPAELPGGSRSRGRQPCLPPRARAAWLAVRSTFGRTTIPLRPSARSSFLLAARTSVSGSRSAARTAGLCFVSSVHSSVYAVRSSASHWAGDRG